jgi:hypothetical protein
MDHFIIPIAINTGIGTFFCHDHRDIHMRLYTNLSTLTRHRKGKIVGILKEIPGVLPSSHNSTISKSIDRNIQW